MDMATITMGTCIRMERRRREKSATPPPSSIIRIANLQPSSLAPKSKSPPRSIKSLLLAGFGLILLIAMSLIQMGKSRLSAGRKRAGVERVAALDC